MHGNTITAETKVQTTVSGGSSATRKTGNLSSSETNWTPPPCWYEPAYTPRELKKSVKGFSDVPLIGHQIYNLLNSIYDGHPYKNYNLEKQGEGAFWSGVVNPNRKDDPKANSCDRVPFWVDENDTPDEPMAVSPKVLAEYAYDELPVPGTRISMNPVGKQTVNLDTWVWLDKAKFKPISVTASIPGTGFSATTTAKPLALRIDPGTEDAKLYPASGECPIGEDGSIGAPYSDEKKGEAPPCGLTYLRSTAGTGPHHLQATLTWKITWKSSQGQGGNLPDGTFGNTTDVTVQEHQAVNR